MVSGPSLTLVVVSTHSGARLRQLHPRRSIEPHSFRSSDCRITVTVVVFLVMQQRLTRMSAVMLVLVLVLVLVSCRCSCIMSSPLEVQLQQQLLAAQQQQQQTVQDAQKEINALRSQLQQQQQLMAAASSSSPSASSSSSSSSFPSGSAGPHPSMSHISLKPMQPSSFHGAVGSNAEQWLVELERYFTVVGLGEADPRRALLASTYLKDAASGWYVSAVKEPDFGASPPWQLFKERFLTRFRPLAASRMARAAIRNLKHRYKVAGYSQEFQKQMQLIPDMSVADQIEFYICGLQAPLAQEVDREQPKSLAEAMEAAQRIELLTSTRRGAATNPYGRTVPYFRGHSGHASQTGGDPGDRMDLSAVRSGVDEGDFYYENEQEDQYQLSAMSYRGGRGRERGRSGPGGFFRGSGPSRGSKHSAPGMSREEFDKLMKEGKCFKCKETGHLARNCQKSSSTN